MSQVLANGFVAGSGYALVGLGIGLIWSLTRFLNFSYGAVYITSAYVAYALVKWAHLPIILSMCIAVLVGACLGGLMEFAVFRTLRRAGSSQFIMFVASFGLLICFQNLVSVVFGDRPRILRTGNVQEGILMLSVRMTKPQILIFLSSVVVAFGMWIFLFKTKAGKIIRATASDPFLARVHGINTDREILYVFFIGSAVASIASVLIGLDTDLTPAMGLNALMMGTAAVVIGGMGSIYGPMLGGFFIGFVQHIGVWKLPTQWRDAIVFAVVILFLVFRPQGFFGKPLKSTDI